MNVSQAQLGSESMTYTDQPGCIAQVDVGGGKYNNNVYCTGCADPRVILEKTINPENVALNPNLDLDEDTISTITIVVKNYSELSIKGTVWDAINASNIELVEDIEGTIYDINVTDYYTAITPTENELKKIDIQQMSSRTNKFLQNEHYKEISDIRSINETETKKKNKIMQINKVSSKIKRLNGKFDIIGSEIEMMPPESVEYPWFFLDKQLERMDGISFSDFNYLLKWDIVVEKCVFVDGVCPAPTIHKIVYTVKPVKKGTIKLGRSFIEYSNSITDNFDIEIQDSINPIIKSPGETEIVNLSITNSSPVDISNFSITVLGDLGYRNWISFPGREKKCSLADHEATNVNMWVNAGEISKTNIVPIKISIPENETEKAETGIYVGYVNVCLKDTEDGKNQFQLGRSQNCKHVPLVVMVERPVDYSPAIDLGYLNHPPDDCLPCTEIIPSEETCGTCSVQQKVVNTINKPIENAKLEVSYLDKDLNYITNIFTTDSNGIANVTYPYGESLNCLHKISVSKSDDINPNMAEITSHIYERHWLSCNSTDTIIGYHVLEILIEAPETVAAAGAYNMVVTANIPVFEIVYTQATRGLHTTVYKDVIPPKPPIDIVVGSCGDGVLQPERGEECDPPGTLGGVYTASGSHFLCGNDCFLYPQQVNVNYDTCDFFRNIADSCNDYETKYMILPEEEIVPDVTEIEVGEGATSCLDWQNCTQLPCNHPQANQFYCDNTYEYVVPPTYTIFSEVSGATVYGDSGTSTDTTTCSTTGCQNTYFSTITNTERLSDQFDTKKPLVCTKCVSQPGSSETPLDLWNVNKGDVAGEALVQPDELVVKYEVLSAECQALKNEYYESCTKTPNRLIIFNNIGSSSGSTGSSEWGGGSSGGRSSSSSSGSTSGGGGGTNNQCTLAKDGCCYPISDGTCDPDCEGIFGFCETPACADIFNTQEQSTSCYSGSKTINCSSDPDCTMVSWVSPEITVVGVKVIKMTLNETVIVNDEQFKNPVKISAYNTVRDVATQMWARLTMVWLDGTTKKFIKLSRNSDPLKEFEIKQGIGEVGVGQEFYTEFSELYAPDNSEIGGADNLPTVVNLVAEVFEGVCDPDKPESLTNCYKGYRNEEGISGLGLGVPTDVYFGTLGKVEAPIVVTKPALLNISFITDMDKDGIDDILQQVNKGEVIDIGVKVENNGGAPAKNAFVQISNRCMQNTNTVTLESGECLGSCTEFQKTETTWKQITKTMEKLELASGQPARMDFGTLAPMQSATAIFSMKANKGQNLEYVYQCFEANAENIMFGNLYNGNDPVDGVPHNIYFRNIKAGDYSIFVSPRSFLGGNLDITNGNAYVSAPFRLTNTTSAYMNDLTASCTGSICNSGILSINGKYFTQSSTIIIGNVAGGGTAPLFIGLRANSEILPGTYSGVVTLTGHLNSGDVVFAGINIEENENGIIEFKSNLGKPIQKDVLDFSGLIEDFKEQSIEFIGFSGIDSTVNFEGENELIIPEFSVTNAISFKIKNPNTKQILNSIEIVAPILKETSFPVIVKNESLNSIVINLKTNNSSILFFKDKNLTTQITTLSLLGSEEKTVNLMVKPPYGSRSMKYLYYATFENASNTSSKIDFPVLINVPVNIDLIPIKFSRELNRGEKSCSMLPLNDVTGKCVKQDPNIITLINYSKWPTQATINYDSNWVEIGKEINTVNLDGYDSDILDFNLTVPFDVPSGGYLKRIGLNSSGNNTNALIYIDVPNDLKVVRETKEGDESLSAIIKATFENTTVSETIKVISSISQIATIEYNGIGINAIPNEWIQINKTNLAMIGADCTGFTCNDNFDVSISVPEGQPSATYTGILTINANNNFSKVYITLIVMPKPTIVTYPAYNSSTGLTQNRTITAPVHITYTKKPNLCGNGFCDDGENPSVCVSDCGSTGGINCGNDVCEPGFGETAQTCSYDCTTAVANFCGDGYCGNPETNINCPNDCGSTGGINCGNSICGPGENNTNCSIDCIDPTDVNVEAFPIIIRSTPNHYSSQIYDGTNDYTNIDISNNSPADSVTFNIQYEEYGQGLPRSWLKVNLGKLGFKSVDESYLDKFTLLAKNIINIPTIESPKVNETQLEVSIEVPPLAEPGVYSGKFLIKSEVWSGGTKGSGIRIFYNEDIFPILIKVPERIIVSKNQINTTVPDGTTSSSQSFSITNYGGKIDLENVVLSVDKVGQNPIEPEWINFGDNNFTVYSGVENAKTVNFTITVPEGKSFGVTSGMIRITGTLAKLNDYKNYIMVFITTPKRLDVICSISSEVKSCSPRGININVPSSYVLSGGSVPVNFRISNTKLGSSIMVGSRYKETGEGFWDDKNVYIGSQKQSEGPFMTPTPINAQGSQNVQMNLSIPVGVPPGTYTGKIEFEYQMEKIIMPIKISIPFKYQFDFNQTETEVFDGTPTKIGSITTTVINEKSSAVLSITNRGSSSISPFWFKIGEPVKWLAYDDGNPLWNEGDNTYTTDLNITVPATNRTTTNTYAGYISVVFTATATFDRIPFLIKVKNSITPNPKTINLVVGDGGVISTVIGIKNESPNALNIFKSNYVEFSPIGGKPINIDWVSSQPSNNKYVVEGGTIQNENIMFEVPLSNSVDYDYYDYIGRYSGNVGIKGKINQQIYNYNIPISITIPKSMEVVPSSGNVSGKYDGEIASFNPFTITNNSAVAIENLEFASLETGLNSIKSNWVSGSFDSTTIPGCIDQNNCNTTKLHLNVTLPLDTSPGTYTADVLINGTKTKDNETKTVLSKISIAVQVIERFALKNNQSSISLVTLPGTGDSFDCDGNLKPKNITGGPCNSELSCGDSGFIDECNPWGVESSGFFTVENRGTTVTLICMLEKKQTGTKPAETDWLTLEVDGSETSEFIIAPKANSGDATVEKIVNVKVQVPQIPKGAYTASITTRCYGSDLSKARNKTINVTLSTPLFWGVNPPATNPPTTPNWQSNTFSYDYPLMNEGDPIFTILNARSNNEATGVVVTLLDPPSGKSAKNWLSLDRTILMVPKGGSNILMVSGNAPIGSNGIYSALLQFKTTLTSEIKSRIINFTVESSLKLTSNEVLATTTEGITTVLNDAFGIKNGTTGTFDVVTYSILGSSSEGKLPIQPSWFEFSNGSSGWTGNTIVGGETGLVNVLVTPSSGTTAGVYTGEITVTTQRSIVVNGVPSTITQSIIIPVTVTVGDTLSLDKISIIKSVVEGEIGTEAIIVTNNSTVSGVNVTSTVSGAWPTGWVTVTPEISQMIGNGTNKVFTINVNVPKSEVPGENAGEYKGVVTFVSDKTELKTVNLIVRVNTSVVIDNC